LKVKSFHSIAKNGVLKRTIYLQNFFSNIDQNMDKNIAALFDMDGVLVDSNPYHKIAFQNFLKQHEITLTDDELATHVYGRTNKEIMPYIFGNAFKAEQSEKWAGEKESLFRELYKEDIRPVAGLVPFLEELKKAGIRMAVGTSAPIANLDFILDKINVRHYFDALLHSGDVTHGKPNPEIYLNAAARLGINPTSCVVFEDSLAGVRAGLNAGMKVIGITTTHSREELESAHLVINDFTELSVEQVLSLF
jgi:beta-phosphoglucomutase family hydrolase